MNDIKKSGFPRLVTKLVKKILILEKENEALKDELKKVSKKNEMLRISNNKRNK